MSRASFHATPVFSLGFGFIFFMAQRLYRRFKLSREDRAMVASCSMSLCHGVPAAAVAAWQLWLAWPIKVDSINTGANQLLLQYTLAYMIADTVLYLLPYTPTDFLFCAHHLVVIVYVVTTILHGSGGVSCIFMLLFGECTSLWQNSWYICNTLQGQRKWVASYLGFLSTMYPGSYILARSIVGPPSVVWLCQQIGASKTIYPPYRIIWIAICLVSLAGSQLWSFGLAKTWLKGEQEPKKLAEKLK